MILWLVLFLLVVAISFVLALGSMKGYQEAMPEVEEEYSLFLIRKTANLNAALLNSLRDHILASDLIISIERLFKGRRAALVIFGPRTVLEQYVSELDLLELEDYSLNFKHDDMYIWEVGVKNLKSDNKNFLLKHLPSLFEEDQFLWQIVLGASGKNGFRSQIRAALYCGDSLRRSQLALDFEKLSEDLVQVPETFSKERMISSWKLRSLSRQKWTHALHPEKVMNFVKI